MLVNRLYIVKNRKYCKIHFRLSVMLTHDRVLFLVKTLQRA